MDYIGYIHSMHCPHSLLVACRGERPFALTGSGGLGGTCAPQRGVWGAEPPITKILFSLGFISLLLGIILAIYLPSLSFGFLSDDFDFLNHQPSDIFSLFKPQEGTYHYIPLGLLVFPFLRLLLGLEPWRFHFLAILLHMACTFSVSYLAWLLSASRGVALLSGLFFASFFLHYEVVMWASGIFTSLTTLCSLLAFFSFRSYLIKGKRGHYGAFMVLFPLALLTLESAITLPLLCLIYEALFPSPGNKKNLRRALRKYLPPLALLALYLLVRASSSTEWTAFERSPFLRAVDFVKSWLILFSFNGILSPPVVQDLTPLSALITALLCISTFMAIMVWGKNQWRFCLLWALINLLPFTLFSIIQARYFYLPAVGSSILLALLGHEGTQLLRNKVPFKSLRAPLSLFFLCSYCALAFLPGIKFLEQRRYEWQEASQIVTHIIAETKRLMPNSLKGHEIYFVNIPDGVEGKGAWRAYIFRNGFREALSLAYGEEEAQVHTLRTPAMAKNSLAIGSTIEEEELAKLRSDPTKIVLIYDWEKKALTKATRGVRGQ